MALVKLPLILLHLPLILEPAFTQAGVPPRSARVVDGPVPVVDGPVLGQRCQFIPQKNGALLGRSPL